MRWKLLRRRWSINAPRVIVRRHLPWPLRWAVLALTLGFSAAIALWAFEFGKGLAGLDRDAKRELAELRVEVSELRSEREKARAIADTAESLLKAERATQEHLAQQVKEAEADNLSLRADLGFFERLLPVSGDDGLAIRGARIESVAPGQLKFLLLVMQSGKAQPVFDGTCDFTLSGILNGKPWSLPSAGGPRPVQLKQYLRLEGLLEYPAQAVVKSVEVRITNSRGELKATQSLKP